MLNKNHGVHKGGTQAQKKHHIFHLIMQHKLKKSHQCVIVARPRHLVLFHMMSFASQISFMMGPDNIQFKHAII